MPAPLLGLSFKASLYVLEVLSMLCFLTSSAVSVDFLL